MHLLLNTSKYFMKNRNIIYKSVDCKFTGICLRQFFSVLTALVKILGKFLDVFLFCINFILKF